MLTSVMLISHTLADFVIQTEKMVEDKKEMNFYGYIKHGFALVFIPLLLILLLEKESISEIIYIILIITLIHLGIDFVKEKINVKLKEKKISKKSYVLIFILDQIIHIFIIIFLTCRINLEFSTVNNLIVDKILIGKGLTDYDLKKIFMVIYISFSGAYLIPLILDVIYEKIDNYSIKLNEILKADINNDKAIENDKGYIFIDEVRTGKWIGILERILITILICLNQFTSIGFIIAVKSLARFKMMENKIFSEYYLIGTLLSLTYTFVLYLIFSRILLF